MDSDCGYQITCTLPYLTIQEMEKKGKNEISKQVLMTKEYDQRYLHTL